MLRNHIYYPNAQKPGVCRICGEKKAKCQSYGTEDPAWIKPPMRVPDDDEDPTWMTPAESDRERIVRDIKHALEKKMIAHIDTKDEFVLCVTRAQLMWILDMAEQGDLDPAPPKGISPKVFPKEPLIKWPPD